MKQRIISSVLSLILAIIMIPANIANAANYSSGNISDLGDGVTYYDVKSENFEKSTQLFIQDLLTAQNSKLGNKSIASEWQKLAYAMQKEVGTGTDDDKFKKHFSEVLQKGLAYEIGDLVPYDKNIDETIDNDDTYNVYSTGLTYTTSVATATNEMEKIVYDRYYKYGSRDKQSDAVASNTTLKSSTGAEDVFYYLTGAFKKSGTYKKGHYQALGVIFSDFKVSPIVPDDDAAYTTTSSTPVSTVSPVVAEAINDASTSANVSQEVSSTTTVVVTNEINGSEEYHYGQSFSSGLEFGSEKGPVRGHIDIALDWEQVMTEGWSNSNSVEETDTTTTIISKDMPAYTSMVLTQSDSILKTTSTYDCPVVLEFSVIIVEYTLDPSSNGADPKTKIISTFDGNAREQLKNRAVTNKSLKDVSGLYWTNLYKNTAGTSTMVEDQMAISAPMSYTGAVFSTSVTSKNLTFDKLLPLYPLDNVKTVEKINEISLNPGEYIFPYDIEVNGFNHKENGEYFGFDSEQGSWILLDENDKEITDDTVNPVAKLEFNAISGTTKLVGYNPGTAYLKYLIDEDCYYSVDKINNTNLENPSDAYTKNKDLSETVVIEIKVTETPFDGTIVVGGSYQGVVGDEPVALNETGLTLTVYDATDKEIEPSNYPIVWESQELPSKGILVENNKISFTKEGTFHVRAKIGSVYSNWQEVTALPAASLAKISIPEYLTLTSDDTITYNLKDTSITLLDQYGRNFKTSEEIIWHCDGANSKIENGILKIASGERPNIWLTIGNIKSNNMQLKYNSIVNANRPYVTSIHGFVNRLSHEGGIVEFKVRGTNLDKGIVKFQSGGISCVVDKYTAFMEFPANTTNKDIVYTIVSNTNSEVTAQVIVEALHNDSETIDKAEVSVNSGSSDKTASSDKAASVKTGDINNPILFAIIFFISLASIIVNLIKRNSYK